METEVGVGGIDEAKLDDMPAVEAGSPPSSPREIADPVVYKLVRVVGDGSMVPATDDEVMEVEDLLEGDKSEIHPVADTGQNVGCASNDEFPSTKTQFDDSEGQCENPEVDTEKSHTQLDRTVELEKLNAGTEELHPSSMGMATKLAKEALGVRDNKIEKKVFKARSTSGWIQKPPVAESEKDEQYQEIKSSELEKGAELKHMDSSGYYSDDYTGPVPTAKVGMRRKHHRPWTLSEVVKLVEGVARYGVGRWSEIKRLAFASYSYRTSVDLKDKWRNLLRASFANSPSEKGMLSSRKHVSVPIPAPILLRVRELAEIQAQVPPNLSSSKFAAYDNRNVHETRSGYL